MRYVLSADTRNVIVSYPRSGTTWLEALLGTYLKLAYGLPEDMTMRPIELTRAGKLPVLTLTHDPQRLDAAPPAIAEDYAGRRVALNLRDPRDVLVSLYLHDRYRRKVIAEDVMLAEYVRQELPRILTFYETWLSEPAGTFGAFTTVTYEGLHADTAGELRRLAGFFGYAVRDDVLPGAVAFGSFGWMQELERSGKLSTFYHVPGTEPLGDERAMRTRQGQIGGYMGQLDAVTLTWVNEQIAATARVKGFYQRG